MKKFIFLIFASLFLLGCQEIDVADAPPPPPPGELADSFDVPQEGGALAGQAYSIAEYGFANPEGIFTVKDRLHFPNADISDNFDINVLAAPEGQHRYVWHEWAFYGPGDAEVRRNFDQGDSEVITIPEGVYIKAPISDPGEIFLGDLPTEVFEDETELSTGVAVYTCTWDGFDWDCNDGLWPAYGINFASGCLEDSHCDAGLECAVDTGECFDPLVCTTTDDCSGGYICVGNICIPPPDAPTEVGELSTYCINGGNQDDPDGADQCQGEPNLGGIHCSGDVSECVPADPHGSVVCEESWLVNTTQTGHGEQELQLDCAARVNSDTCYQSGTSSAQCVACGDKVCASGGQTRFIGSECPTWAPDVIDTINC